MPISRRPQDLKGKKVGWLTGSSGDWYASKYIAAFGLKEGPPPDGVTQVNVAAPEFIPALQRGDIQAFFGWEPWVTKAPQIVQGAHVLHNGGDNGLFILMNCMVMNEDWVTQRSRVGQGDDARADRGARRRQQEHSASGGAAPRARCAFRQPSSTDMTKCCTFKVDYTEDFQQQATEAADWAKTKGMLKDVPQAALLKDLMYPDLLRSVAPDRVTIK